MSVGKQRCKLGVFDQSEWLVVALALFILDNVALIIELFIGHRAEQMAHAVRFKKQRKLERAGRHGFEIIGAIEPGGAVEIGRADIFKRSEEQTSELQSIMRISYAVFCLTNNKNNKHRKNSK